MWNQDTEDVSYLLSCTGSLWEGSVSLGGMQFHNGNNSSRRDAHTHRALPCAKPQHRELQVACL